MRRGKRYEFAADFLSRTRLDVKYNFGLWLLVLVAGPDAEADGRKRATRNHLYVVRTERIAA